MPSAMVVLGAMTGLCARHESAQESSTPAMLYSDLLDVVHAHLAEEWGVAKDAALNEAFGSPASSCRARWSPG